MEQVLKALEETKDLMTDKFGEFEKRMSAMETLTKPRKVSLPGVDEGKESFSFLKAINAIRSGDWKHAGFEKAVFDETEKKAGSTGSDSAGGYIVPSQYVASIIEMLMQESIIASMGATYLNNLSASPLEIPKQTGGATAYWVDENADITSSDLAFGQLSLTPKACAAMIKMSNRLIKLSNPSAEAMVRRDIVNALALEIDRAALRGSGIGSEPKGIKNTSNINTLALGTNGDAFTLDAVADMIGKIEDSHALRGKLGFVFNAKVKRMMFKQKVAQYSGDTAGMPLLMPMSDVNLKNLIGYDFKTFSGIPTDLTKGSGSNLSEVYFGNWEELIIANWGGLEIMASSETSDAFQKNQTWVRVIQELDMGLRHPESFCLCSDAETV